ncbi:MAG: NADH-quinone oxidoreductase subunit M [Bacteroidota bacterium]
MAELLLQSLIFTPLVGALFILAFRSDQGARSLALIFSVIPFLASIWLYFSYTGEVAAGNVDENGFVYFINLPWFTSGGFEINYTLGLDGISIYLVLLTTLLFPLTIYFSWGSIGKHEIAYYILLLFLETGVIGFFLSLDMLLFYIFFEMVLIPMYFLIGIWGGKERIYASLKFFLYTLVGSLLMLIAIIYLGINVPGKAFTTSYLTILEQAEVGISTKVWLFWAFTLSFAIKVPLFPVHTWLPDAHTQAPTAGSVILAGVLLKMGTYGLIRFCLPLFPEASVQFAPLLSGFAVVGIIYGAMAAMVQKDVKKLVAYSSVSHLGFIVLGIFAFTEEAMSGAIIQMVNHGIATGALFLVVGMIYDRRHTRMISDFQGLAKRVPIFTLVFMITVMASVGLPGLNGFVGEFLVLMGSFKSTVISQAFAIFAASGVIIAAVYLLWMFRRVMFGELDKEENRNLIDLNGREVAVMLPLIILMFWMGFYATPFLKQISSSSDKVVAFVLEENNLPSANKTLQPLHEEEHDEHDTKLSVVP